MIWKRYIVTKLFIATGFLSLFATPQIPDKLIYKGDTLSVYHLYLPDELYIADTEHLFGDKQPYWITSCWRGYQATWEVIEDQLYVTDIYSCSYYKDSIKADLVLLFNKKVVDGKVKATWVTGNFISPQGEKFIDNPKYEK